MSLYWIFFTDGATPCDSITVSLTNYGQTQLEGLYRLQADSNISCSDRPVWKSQLIDSWIYYSAGDAAWYIADVTCAKTPLANGRHATSCHCNMKCLFQTRFRCEVLRYMYLTCVCVPARVSQKPRVRTAPNLHNMVPVAHSSYDESVICHVISVIADIGR